MRVNHNTLAGMFGVLTILVIAALVRAIPEISIAPLETYGRDLLKLAMFFASWTIALRFLGGWKYSVTEDAKQQPYGMVYIACALIIGCAIVIMK